MMNPKYTVSVDEIEAIRYLIERAFNHQQIERDWAFDDWDAFCRVISRERSQAALFEITPEQFDRCVHAAFVLLNEGES
jgi:hypothetical protein